MSRDSGVITEKTWSDSMSECGGNVSTSWDVVVGVTAKDTTTHSWDEIDHNGSNIWEFNLYFEDRPGNMIYDGCPDNGRYYPEPRGFGLRVEISNAEDATEMYFPASEPQDGDGGSSNELLGLALDILDGSGNKFVSAGSTLIDYVMTDQGATVNKDSLKSEYEFDIPLKGGYSDFPRMKNNEPQTVGAQLRVRNEYASGTHCAKYFPEFTFMYQKPGYYHTCGCDYITHYYKTTAYPYTPLACFEAVDSWSYY